MSSYICPTHRMYNTKSEPNINYRLWVTRMCQCRFANCNKCTSLVGEAGGGEGWGHTETLPSQFCCEPKTVLKENESQNIIFPFRCTHIKKEVFPTWWPVGFYAPTSPTSLHTSTENQARPDGHEAFSVDSCKQRKVSSQINFPEQDQSFYFFPVVTDIPSPMRYQWHSTYGNYIFQKKATVSEAEYHKNNPFFLHYWQKPTFPTFCSSFTSQALCSQTSFNIPLLLESLLKK